ncbi:MAG: hypothetical protein IPP51_00555 [Bacteroidetes bacterium]|nr:hypothetical protein [Bacteroidota bacterium]
MAANNRSLLLVFILLFAFQFRSDAQQQIPFLERKISLELNGETPERALKLIEQKGGFTFAYGPRVLENQKPVRISVNTGTIREILSRIFSDEISYKERGNHIILTRSTNVKSDNSPVYFLISGYVVDGKSGDQISEVSVYEKKSRESSVSNKYGFFKLKIKKDEVGESLHLIANKSTYKDTVVFVRQAGNSLLNITLYPIEEAQATIDSLSIQDSLMRVDQLAFVNLLLNKEQEVNTKNVKDTIYRKFQASFIPYIGTNLKLSGNTVNDYSLNVLGGYAMGTRKLEIGGLVNVDRDSVSGVQIAGLGNIVGGPVKGVQIAGLMNYNLQTTKGVEVGGLLNFNRDSVEGFQLAGLVNTNLNYFEGFQGAGLINVNLKESSSCQAAGLLNVSLAKMNGTQVSGLLNVSRQQIDGAQISGFINYASVVHGSQIGFLNIADSISGVPIGFLSFVRKGYHQLEVSSNEVFSLNVAFRTGVNALYNILEAGMKVDSASIPVWAFGYGLGSSVSLGKKWRLGFDLTVHQPLKGNDLEYFNPIAKLNVTFEKRFSKYFSLAAGPSINTFFYNTNDARFHDVLDVLPPSWAFDSTVKRDYKNVSWVGGKVALRFF